MIATEERSGLFRIHKEGEPPIVSALEANAMGFKMLREYPIPEGGEDAVRLSLVIRYLQLVRSQEYKQAVDDPLYSGRLEQLTSGEAQAFLDALDTAIGEMAHVQIEYCGF